MKTGFLETKTPHPEACSGGCIARLRGEPKSTNPYNKLTDEWLHCSWLQGWQDTDNDPHAPKQPLQSFS